jgi:uncharacterized membrane protein
MKIRNTKLCNSVKRKAENVASTLNSVSSHDRFVTNMNTNKNTQNIILLWVFTIVTVVLIDAMIAGIVLLYAGLLLLIFVVSICFKKLKS